MKQQIISLLERAKENGTTIGDVLAEVRGFPDGWQSIETAPKDGAEIWGFNGEQARMLWSEGEHWVLWVWADSSLADIDPSPDQPTHWMPIPAAPGADSPTSRPATPAAAPAEGLPNLPQLLRENADLDAAEGGNPDVAALEWAAADEIERLRREVFKLRATAASAEPVAFYKDGVLFWHGEHAAWRGKDGELYAGPPAPSERAPVGDERAAFKKCHAAIIKAISSIARADGPDTRKEDDPELLYRSPVMDEVVRIRGALDEYSAALASAPVAGEAVATVRGSAGESWKGDAIIDLRPGLALAAGTELFLAHAAPQASPAADGRDAKDAAPAAEWMTCESRRPWVTNSLAHQAKKLRRKERGCRIAFRKDYMGAPTRYLADVYGEAAAVFEARIAAIAAQQGEGGGK